MADEVKETTESSTTETTTTAASTSPVQTSKSSSNMMMYIVAFLLTLLVAGGAAFFLMQDKDSDKDDNNSEESSDSNDDEEEANQDEDVKDEDSEDEDTNDNENDGSYSNDEYSFDYNEDFFLDDSDFDTLDSVSVFRVDPDEIEDGDFNDNVSIKKLGVLGQTSMSDSECQDFGDGVVSELETNYSADYEDVVLSDYDSTEINDQEVCMIRFESTYSGVEIVQEQYLFINSDEEGDSYLITLTTYPDSEFYEDLTIVPMSFEIEA